MKIMLDECFARTPSVVVQSYLTLAAPDVEVHFVLDYFGETRKDSNWAHELSKQQGVEWAAITFDRGRNTPSIDGPPLHRILPRCGITGIYLSGRIQCDRGEVRARAVISLWPEIRARIENSKPGSRFKLSKRKGDKFGLRPW